MAEREGKQEPVDERRGAARLVVDRPAQFRTAGRVLPGRLSDLGEGGARFECVHPPREGWSGLLAWDAEQHFGTVVWVRGTSCGVQFERPIAAESVDAATRMVETARGSAVLGNIPMAPRRGRRPGG